MNQRLLGESGIRVSAVALGTWAMGGDVAVWGHTDDRESIAAIQQAMDCGINLIDTAPIYGNGHAEEIVGKAVSGRRDDVVIATKCGLVPPERKYPNDFRPMIPALWICFRVYPYLRRSFRTSRRNWSIA